MPINTTDNCWKGFCLFGEKGEFIQLKIWIYSLIAFKKRPFQHQILFLIQKVQFGLILLCYLQALQEVPWTILRFVVDNETALVRFMRPIDFYASNQQKIGFFMVLQSKGMVPKHLFMFGTYAHWSGAIP